MAPKKGRSKQSNLHQQDLTKLNITKLKRGKSTVVKVISGVQTVRFNNELKRNITIKLDRLSKTVVKMYLERAAERDENTFLETFVRSNKQRLSLDPEDITTAKKQKKSKNARKPQEYIVEKVLEFKYKNGKELFLVQWKGYSSNDNTWEPIHNLDNCPAILNEFLGSEEVRYYDKIEQIKAKLSSGDLISEENLIKRLPEVQETDLLHLKNILTVKLISMITLPEKYKCFSFERVQKTRDVLQLYSITRKRCLQLMTLKKWVENVTIKLDCLLDTVVNMYLERAAERDENIFLKKIVRSKKIPLSLDLEDITTAKKQNKCKNTRKPQEYIIEKILEFKYEDGKELFLVKWKGYSSNDNTWEPSDNLDNCPAILNEFLESEEVRYCDKIEQLKKELSFGDFLSEENLIKRLPEVQETDLLHLKNTLTVKLISMITLPEKYQCFSIELVQKTKDVLQLYSLTRKRCRQFMTLNKWEEHMNQVDTSKKKISVENDADFVGPPENFTYTNQLTPGDGVIFPNESRIGCECLVCNSRSKMCCGMQDGRFPYTVNKKLRLSAGMPIYECNKNCKCSSKCSNRVVQRGRNIKVTIFRTSNGCGWGVKTNQRILKGQFICQYVGEVITFQQAENRASVCAATGKSYLFDLDFNSAENPYAIDAEKLGNVSRFINHSCEPNLRVYAVWADHLDPDLPMLAFFSKREINVGEQICIDYIQKNFDVIETTGDVGDIIVPHGLDAGIEHPSTIKTRFEIQQENVDDLENGTECKCGSLKCRKYIF